MMSRGRDRGVERSRFRPQKALAQGVEAAPKSDGADSEREVI